MNVDDLSGHIRQRPPRVRWVLTVFVSFTLGMAAAATLFAYTSRIPIPLKESPTRTTDDILSKAQQTLPEPDEPAINFRETLRRRSEGTLPNAQAEPIALPVEQDKQAYYVLAGTFEQAASATQRRDEITAGLSDPNTPIEVRNEQTVGNSPPVHKVLIGPFPSAADADSVRGQLALLGIDTRTELLPLAGAAAQDTP